MGDEDCGGCDGCGGCGDACSKCGLPMKHHAVAVNGEPECPEV